jgi:hypothetical protein
METMQIPENSIARNGSASVRRSAGHELCQEQIRTLDLHGGRYAAFLPVLDPLHTTLRLVVSKQLGKLRRAAEAFDDLPISVGGRSFVHGDIKHHVYS